MCVASSPSWPLRLTALLCPCSRGCPCSRAGGDTVSLSFCPILCGCCGSVGDVTPPSPPPVCVRHPVVSLARRWFAASPPPQPPGCVRRRCCQPTTVLWPLFPITTLPRLRAAPVVSPARRGSSGGRILCCCRCFGGCSCSYTTPIAWRWRQAHSPAAAVFCGCACRGVTRSVGPRGCGGGWCGRGDCCWLVPVVAHGQWARAAAAAAGVVGVVGAGGGARRRQLGGALGVLLLLVEVLPWTPAVVIFIFLICCSLRVWVCVGRTVCGPAWLRRRLVS
ncbi:hypothetical protein I4F81_012176 [Pyropia yezoensis]|uniref:Uncharacterized protein n=1 Tax=Pyropia yezoensis TaxID=2788 RepID=A0ACC3CHX8_PYRYE|nr:hypothetical protein I4F81_012176 [Neopyropia yezoensis]